MTGRVAAFGGGLALAVALVLALAGTASAAGPEALERQLGPGVSISGGAETGGGVTFIGTEPGAAIPLGPTAPRAAALAAASRFAPSFGLRDDAELQVTEVDRVSGGRSSVELQQIVGGVAVIGGELVVNLDAAGDLLSVGGELTPQGSIDTSPRVAEADAAGTALASVARKHGVDAEGLHADAGELSVYDPRILGAPGPLGPRLVWRFEVTGGDPVSIREFVAVDAQLGVVALEFSEIHEAKDRRVCDAGLTQSKVPCTSVAAAREEGEPASGIADVDAAYDLSGGVYDLFLSKFGRDSIDGDGMPLISTVRFCQSSCPAYGNAFWNGEQMTYGAGMVTEDIAGHELTHGVVEHESHLFYYYQSGAINESLADVFGELFDLATGADPPEDRWKLGEGSTIGAIRDMANPPALGDPDRMTSPSWFFDPETSFEDGDGGGVHSNSGVNNKAAYLLTDGDTFNGQTVSAIGAEKVLQLYYEVNANLLTSAGDYQDLGNALRQACTNLTGSEHGITATDCVQVEQAVLATEMDQSPTDDPAAAPHKAATCAPGETVESAFFDDLEDPLSGNWATGVIQAANTFYYPQNSNPFEFDATYATSGTTNIWAYDRQGVSDSAIAMTTDVTVPSGGFMHFRHAYGFDFEAGTGYDGGVIEFSTDGGATWLDAGGLIDSGAEYLDELSSGFGNPLGGRLAFTGESGGYGSTRIDLGGMPGEQVRFRFRVGTDTSIDDYGWFIDDVRIYRCESEPEPDPQPQPGPQPGSSPASSPAPVAVAPPAPQPATAQKKKPKKCGPKQRKVKKKGKVKCVPKKGRKKGKAGKRG